MLHKYQQQTFEIDIQVEPRYVPDESLPELEQYIYLYTVKVTNNTKHTIQLLKRFWKIKNGLGVVEEVEGTGVVGQQPTILPGDSYSYSSFCPLSTPTGNMRGHYEFMDENGIRFWVDIPLFFLRPDAINN